MTDIKNSYAKKLLRVDLTSGIVTTEEFGQDNIERFIGGRGIASKILYDEVPPEVGPLYPENRHLCTGSSSRHGRANSEPDHRDLPVAAD